MSSSPLSYSYGSNTPNTVTKSGRTYPISDSPLSRSSRRSFAPLQKSRWNHRYYLWTEALSGMVSISTPELLCAWRPGMKSPGEPWNKIVSDWFQQKTIKVFLIGPFKFARERVNVRRVWRVSGFFPGNVEVLTRPTDSWFKRFQNKICTTN